MLLFGLALMVGGVAVLVGVRDELGVRVPVLDAIADRVRRVAPAARWAVRAVGLASWPRPIRPGGQDPRRPRDSRRPRRSGDLRHPRRPAPAVGRVAVASHTVAPHTVAPHTVAPHTVAPHTVASHTVVQPAAVRAVGRASPPPSSLVRPQ